MENVTTSVGDGLLFDSYLAEPVLYRECPVTRGFALEMEDDLEGGDVDSLIAIGQLPALPELEKWLMDPAYAAELIYRDVTRKHELRAWQF